MEELAYFWINDLNLLAKMERRVPYLLVNNNWEVDNKNIVMDRLMGYEPGEGIGNSDMLFRIDEIGFEEAEMIMRGEMSRH